MRIHCSTWPSEPGICPKFGQYVGFQKLGFGGPYIMRIIVYWNVLGVCLGASDFWKLP